MDALCTHGLVPYCFVLFKVCFEKKQCNYTPLGTFVFVFLLFDYVTYHYMACMVLYSSNSTGTRTNISSLVLHYLCQKWVCDVVCKLIAPLMSLLVYGQIKHNLCWHKYFFFRIPTGAQLPRADSNTTVISPIAEIELRIQLTKCSDCPYGTLCVYQPISKYVLVTCPNFILLTQPCLFLF